jgi:adenylate kinase
MQYILLRGPPGAGKSVLGRLIQSRTPRSAFVSSGDLLRERMSNDAALREALKLGELVDSSLITGIMRTKYLDLTNAGTQLMITDGFPRKVSELQDWIGFAGVPKLVIYLKCDEELLIQKLMNRRICSSCGVSYNLFENTNMKPILPRVAGRCDTCGGVLVLREDDSERVVRKRLKIHNQMEKPIFLQLTNDPRSTIIEAEADTGMNSFIRIAQEISI